MIFFGIDPGVITGIAVWDSVAKRFASVGSGKAVEAEIEILGANRQSPVIVVFEDARQRKWFGNTGKEVAQGAGSIKRDCQRWQEFLEHHGIGYFMVSPKNNMTKTKADYFAAITGWKGRTNEHARDAAMLVFRR